jgi:methionyl-tRNA formyltransferase
MYDWVRGLTHPFPGAFTTLPDGRRLVVWKADLVELGGAAQAAPGTVLGVMLRAGERDGGVTVAAGTDALALRVVELEGRETQALDLLDAGVIRVGDRLG